MHTMELTAEEVAVVEGMRERAAEEKREKQITLEILRVAYEFEKWLQDNGAGASFSTFCDEFGYEGHIHEVQASCIYHNASAVIEMAATRSS